MIVIGGYHSSNTQKLFDICKTICEKTCHIETVRDLNLNEVIRYQKIGITAGASTPDWIVKEVLEGMEEQNKFAEENAVEEVTAAEVEEVVDGEAVKDEYDDDNFDFADIRQMALSKKVILPGEAKNLYQTWSR
jgi:4-hydroxy-3-methylbut-2-enyl diphosphate reductase